MLNPKNNTMDRWIRLLSNRPIMKRVVAALVVCSPVVALTNSPWSIKVEPVLTNEKVQKQVKQKFPKRWEPLLLDNRCTRIESPQP